MTIRFDDSLPALLDVISRELGENTLQKGMVLRDASGQLAFFTSDKIDKGTQARVSEQLLRNLGPYARQDRVFAGIEGFGVEELLKEPQALLRIFKGYKFRMIDRRLVGSDWMRAPASPSTPPPRFVFASLKGGVGRSTAIAVAASALASRGMRVLAIDLDMEAPGIGSMLLDRATTPEFGIIDALVECNLGGLDEQFFSDLVGPSSLADRQGRIDVVPAFGRRSLENPGDVLAKIARAYADTPQADGTATTLMDHVRQIVDRFADPKRYDAILVDARSGLHETTASAVLGLGAEVFLFGLDEPQTFQGYAALLSHLGRFIDVRFSAPEWVSRIVMVQGKAPASMDRREEFAERCRKLFDDCGFERATAVANQFAIPAEPFNDVPWDDDQPDTEVLSDESSNLRETLAILDDDRFKAFQPLRQGDLLSKEIYSSSYGSFLAAIYQSLGIEQRQ